MALRDRQAKIARGLPTFEGWARSRFRLGRSGLAVLGVAVVTVAGAAVVFAAMLEDVLTRDGIALRDSGFDQAIADHRTPALVNLAKVLSDAGSIGVLVAMAVVVSAVLWARRSRLGEALAPLVSVGLAAVCVAALKALVGRARPDLPLRLLNETEPSFPSGHAADSTAVFVSLAIVLAVVVLRRPLARALAIAVGFAVPALIGLTRLELGVHWPSDVIAGWALGTVAAVGVTAALILLGRFADTAGRDPVGLWPRALHVLAMRRPQRSVSSMSIRTIHARSL